MTRQLYLMRHSQSADKQPDQSDKERQLTVQGMRDAAVIAHYLKKNNYLIDTIVTSDAIRAETTAQTLFDIIKPEYDLQVVSDVYNASVRTLLELVQGFEETSRNVLVVGHNPYISYFAEYLCKAEIGDMTTSGVVIINFEMRSWSDAAEGSGTFDNYFHPAIIEQ